MIGDVKRWGLNSYSANVISLAFIYYICEGEGAEMGKMNEEQGGWDIYKNILNKDGETNSLTVFG